MRTFKKETNAVRST